MPPRSAWRRSHTTEERPTGVDGEDCFFNGTRAQLEMSDRDDDGFNSPEGKGKSDEGQRRKAAPSQLTVEGGALEE